MKKFLMFLIIIISMLFFIGNIHAEEDACDKYKSNEAKKACKEMNEYCFNNFENGETEEFDGEGCFFDENNTTYTRASINESTGKETIEFSNVELTRGYEGIDKDGKVAFVGCYKVEYEGNESLSAGTYFIFKILRPNEDCREEGAFLDLVPAKGNVRYKKNNKVFTGKEVIGSKSATYKWEAQNGGECPQFFGLTSNTTFWTATKNQFVLADKKDNLDLNLKQFRLAFWKIQKYEVNVGCTVEDTSAFEKAMTCYENKLSYIENQSCPSNLSDISSYQQTLEKSAQECNSSFNALTKIDYLKENSVEFKGYLTTKIKEKLTSCQYKQCNLTKTEISDLTKCVSESKFPNGCDGLETSKHGECIASLKSCARKAKISDVNCIEKSEVQKNKALEKVEEIIDDSQNDFIEESLEAAKEMKEDFIERKYDPYFDPVGPSLPGGELNGCSEVLGKNLTALVKASITILQIVAAIIAIVKGMMVLIPPILSHDSDALKKATKMLVTMAIILVIIFIFKPLLKFIGSILEFDTSCIL